MIHNNENLNVTKIYTVGKYINNDTAPKQLNYGRNFSTNEFVFFLSGENKTVIDNIVMHDRPDFLRYMPKGKIDSEYTVYTMTPSVCIDIFFDTDRPLCDTPLGITDMSALRGKFMKIYDIWSKKRCGYYSQSMMILYDIIYCIQNHRCGYATSAQKEIADKAYEYILNNYKKRDFDYKRLCEICNLKHSQFNKLFRNIYNVSPVQLVTKMKIEYAKELLVTAHYSMAEIAEFCGFDNQYYFSSVFKKVTGFPPSKYKIDR